MDEITGYWIEPETYRSLQAIKTRLYNLDDRPFKLGEARDLANTMDAILSQAVENREP